MTITAESPSTPTRRRAPAVVALVLAVLATVVGVGHRVDAYASTTTSQVPGNAVAAHDHPAGPVVAAADGISPGEGRGATTSEPGTVVGSRVAPNTAGRVGGLADDGVNVIPSSGRTFVGTPRGTVYDVPEGWVGRTADNGQGIVYQRPGATGNADMIRIMEPTQRYPSGYAVVHNSYGQPVDVFGVPGPRPATHIPETYRGPWPGWPQ